MRVQFKHGSKREFDHFEVYNYLIPFQIGNGDGNSINLADGSRLGSTGNEEHGTGVYGYLLNSNKRMTNYTGTDGRIYHCAVDVPRWMNETPTTQMDPDLWEQFVHQTLKNIDLLEGYDEQEIQATIRLARDGKMSLPELSDELSNWGVNAESYDSLLKKDPKAFERKIKAICEEMRPTADAEFTVDWEHLARWDSTVHDLFSDFSKAIISRSAEGITCYSKCFFDAFKTVYGEDSGYVASKFDDVIVVLDASKVEIEQVVELSLKKAERQKEREFKPEEFQL